MLQNETCKLLCETDTFSGEDARFINDRIRENYAVNWLIDGLPAAQYRIDERTNRNFYSIGFDLGIANDAIPDQTPRLFNHYDIHVQYHTQDHINYRVVGVRVSPFSKSTKVDGEGKANCNTNEAMFLSEEGANKVVYTYSVYWEVYMSLIYFVVSLNSLLFQKSLSHFSSFTFCYPSTLRSPLCAVLPNRMGNSLG